MASEVHFWRTMNYKCEGCGRTLLMRLEEGCEGPRDDVREFTFSTGQKAVMFRTASGRLVQPVPFGLRCGCGKPLLHYAWVRDDGIDLTVPESEIDFPHFRYDHRYDPQACGIPRNTAPDSTEGDPE